MADDPMLVTLTVGQLGEIITERVALALGDLDLTPPALLDVEGLCRTLGISRSKLAGLRREGLPTIMVGESPRFERDAVMAWVRERSAP